MITRSKSQISTITDLLASSDRLSQICNHTEKIKELQIKLCKNLDSPLNKHVVVADYQQKTLVLHTNSASWAARLRYMAPEILSFFQAFICYNQMLFEIMITRSKSQISTITDLLASSDRLSQICNHTEKIKELQIKLCKNLDSPLNKHVVVADYQQKTLVLHTNSASWAARLRYMAPEILSFFQADMPGLSTIRVKVVLPDPPHQTSRRPVTVSPDTVDGIRQVADKIADPALRSTLSGIAKKLL